MTDQAMQAVHCPICGHNNHCGNIAGQPQAACWCSRETFPQALLNLVPSDQINRSCICKNCLDRFSSS